MQPTPPDQASRVNTDLAGPRDFSLPHDAGGEFTIDGDTFYVARALGTKKLRRLAELAPKLANLRVGGDGITAEAMAETEETIAAVMRIMLRRDSVDRFLARLLAEDGSPYGDDGELEPLDVFKQALPAMQYAMERLTGRPLSASALSSTTPTDGVSGDGATAEALTLINSADVGSLT